MHLFFLEIIRFWIYKEVCLFIKKVEWSSASIGTKQHNSTNYLLIACWP